jgi:hypothetical protein
VAKLSSRASLTSIHLTVDDDAGANSFGHQNQNEISGVGNLRSTKPKFSQTNRVGIVINCNWQPGAI